MSRSDLRSNVTMSRGDRRSNMSQSEGMNTESIAGAVANAVRQSLTSALSLHASGSDQDPADPNSVGSLSAIPHDEPSKLEDDDRSVC